MTTIRLKYSGSKLYRGYDEARKAMVLAFPGSKHDLSPAKAAQVLRDFPKDWAPEPEAAQSDASAPAAAIPGDVGTPPPVETPAPQPALKKKGRR